ncbi:MAG TPA: DUF4249 domain-containing protein [Mucilaginibacter sp.]|nr:DUF4249 domain-containing protein [Mucilaginibacter sp.]
MRKLCITCCVLGLAFFSCKKPYSPKIVSSPTNYLVVEGVINLSVDSTVIKVSRTFNLNSKITSRPELGATVTVEGEHEYVTNLADLNGNGHYWTYDINLPLTQRYRLRIVTSTGDQYLSDYLVVKPTPPIDSIGYTVTNGILNLYVNSHDPSNNTRLYRFDYEDTWRFHAKYQSSYVLDPNTNSIVPRNTYSSVYYCYANGVSSNVLLASTTKLSRDVVYQSTLAHIPLNSEKLESEYSVLVKQYAMTPDAFAFYENLQKNTEQVGSIFDVQPTQFTKGNIHNVVKPNEPVVGYVTMTNVQTKRVYIRHDALPGNVLPVYPFDCKQDSALFLNKQGHNDVQEVLINPPLVYIPTSAITANGGIVGYLYSSSQCADCTLRGHSYPPYWWQGL